MKPIYKYLTAGFAVLAFTLLPTMASTTFTFKTSDGTKSVTINDETVAGIISDNYAEIQSAITEDNLSSSDITTAAASINTATASSGFSSTYSTLTGSLNSFSSALLDSVQAGSTMQNQYANAYIGQIFPGFHFGAGLNVGAASLDFSSFGDALTKIGMGDLGLPETLAFPSLTADLRIGGIILPFDVGFTVMKLNTADLGLQDRLNGIALDYFVIGGDVRYCIWKTGLGPLNVKASITGGFYYTSVDFNYEADGMGADMDLGIGTFTLGAQASAKFLFLVPYVGARLLFSTGHRNWSVTSDWVVALLGGDKTMASLLPKTFSGGSTVGFFDNIRPQLYAGLGIDLFVVDITAGISYTAISNVVGATVSLRFALD